MSLWTIGATDVAYQPRTLPGGQPPRSSGTEEVAWEDRGGLRVRPAFGVSFASEAAMRILTCAVIPAVLTLVVGCGDKSDAVQTTPPAQGGQAAQAPAPAPAAPAPAPARLPVAEHAATMKTIAQSVQAANKALKGADTASETTSVQTLATSFALGETF